MARRPPRHSFFYAASRLDVYGVVDDAWQHAGGALVVVDYKATAKAGDVTTLNQDWHLTFQRQIEVYQWLLRRNGFAVSPTAYCVYANGDLTAERFDQMLQLRMTVIPYTGSDSWVEPCILAARECLAQAAPPPAAGGCRLCQYVKTRSTDDTR